MEILNYTSNSLLELTQTGIYKIEHSSKPGQCYIGSAVGLTSCNGYFGFLRRWMKHLTELKNNKHANLKLQRVVTKYGIEGLTFSIVEYCSPEQWEEREDFYITFYNSYNEGFNLRPKSNSNLGTKHSKESLKKMSLAQKGRVIKKESIEKANATKRLKKQLGLVPKFKARFLSRAPKSSKKVYIYTRDGAPFACCYSGQDCDRFFNIGKGKSNIYLRLKTFIKKKYLPSYTELTKEEVIKRVNEISKSRSDRNYRMWEKRKKNKKIPC